MDYKKFTLVMSQKWLPLKTIHHDGAGARRRLEHGGEEIPERAPPKIAPSKMAPLRTGTILRLDVVSGLKPFILLGSVVPPYLVTTY